MKRFFQKILQKLPIEFLAFFGFLLLGILLNFLDRQPLIVTFVIFGLVYIVVLKPRMDKKRDRDIFGAKVLAYLNALSMQLSAYGVYAGDLERFAKEQLNQKFLNPKAPVGCTGPNGMWYGAITGADYPLFAIICIIRFAESYGNEPLLSWAQCQLAPVHNDSIHHRW